jgi:hypothetical protein
MQGRETMQKPCTSKLPAKHPLTTAQETAKGHPFIFEETTPPCKRKSPNLAKPRDRFHPHAETGKGGKRRLNRAGTWKPCMSHAKTMQDQALKFEKDV